MTSTETAPAVNTPSKETCHRCEHPFKHEYYWYLGLYDFDVTRARAMVADGREPVEVDEESVRASLEKCSMCWPHVDHVDPRYPGIIAHVRYRTNDGEMIYGHVLIDGNHRAARCLRDGLPFFAQLLTEEESQEILVLSPEIGDRRPWKQKKS